MVLASPIKELAEKLPSIYPELEQNATQGGVSPSASLKALQLFRQGRVEDSLNQFKIALELEADSPISLTMQAGVFMGLHRFEEAFECYGRSYALREKFGDAKQRWLKLIVTGWSLGALLHGLNGIFKEELGPAELGVNQYIQVREKAIEEGLEGALSPGLVEMPDQPWSDKLREAVEELDLMIRLLSIKDPFEGWRALGEVVSQRWPKGLSAVKAVREMRR